MTFADKKGNLRHGPAETCQQSQPGSRERKGEGGREGGKEGVDAGGGEAERKSTDRVHSVGTQMRRGETRDVRERKRPKVHSERVGQGRVRLGPNPTNVNY